MISQSKEMEFAISIAEEAGEVLLQGLGTGVKVEQKSDYIDLVTEYDRRSENLILARIREEFPSHRILAEESGLSAAGEEPLWIIDPLDGTTNYAHGLPIFCVSIALSEKGQTKLGVVYDPTRREVFWAERGKGAYLGEERISVCTESELRNCLLVTGFPYDAWTNPENNLDHYSRFAIRSRGVRRLGSAAIDLAYVAAGRLDGYWELRLAPWDVAAGGLIAEEAGARVTDVNGESDYLAGTPSILAANPALHKKMWSVLWETDIP